MATPPGPFEACLLPLNRIALKSPGLEGQVIWREEDEWQAQDDDADMLDAEELAFYAEGLLIEGFSLVWQVYAEEDAPKEPVLARLFFWQGNPAPQVPAPDDGWVIVAQGQHLPV